MFGRRKMETEKKHPTTVEIQQLIRDEWDLLVERRRNVPGAAVVEVTTGCSAGKCSHCYASAVAGRGEEMPLELVFSILGGLSQTGNRPNEVWITGGEPGIYPYLPTVAKSATELGFVVCIVTNREPFADLKLVEKVAPFTTSFTVTLRSFLPLQHQMMMGGIPPKVLGEAVRHWGEQPFDPPEEI
jgi:MoaA/NifB/PqqE/SkfB family radical SAM enzyme